MTPIQRLINQNTGVTRMRSGGRRATTRNTQNAMRRKSRGGQGG
jgi:hypothetical protein